MCPQSGAVIGGTNIVEAYMSVRSASPERAGAGTPTSASWSTRSMRQETLSEYSTAGEPCPSCDRTFETVRAMKIHYKQAHGESLAGVEVECSYCGDSKIVKAYQAEERDRHFCHDKNCKGKWQTENLTGDRNPNWNGGDVEVVCEGCDDTFTTKPSLADDARFCSYDCQGAWRTRNWVGSQNPNWRGGERLTIQLRQSVGPASWEHARGRARADAGNECEMCGLSGDDHFRSLDVHHIVPVRAGGCNAQELLMVLCPTCHKKVEQYTMAIPGVERVMVE